MHFLNSKQRKKFYAQLSEQYGYDGPREHALFEGGSGKVYAVSKDIDAVDFHEMNIRQGGLYVANTKGDDLRLTMDGAMLFGGHCQAIVDVSEDAKNDWMAGRDISYEGEQHGYVLVRYNQRILGCGSVSGDGYVKNYVPKGRRITDPH